LQALWIEAKKLQDIFSNTAHNLSKEVPFGGYKI